MFTALALAIGQLGDGRVLRVLAKSALATLGLFVVLGGGAWWIGDMALERAGLNADLRGLAILLGIVLGGWLLWRIIALAVLQFFADEVVQAVESRHYPAAAVTARQLGFREELGNGLRSAGRALGYNLLALPVALALLVTGVGAPLVFGLVNAVLIGRELTELAWLRHSPPGIRTLPLAGFERFALGGLVTALLTVPIANLLAPLLGAAMATHLVHRKGLAPHAS